MLRELQQNTVKQFNKFRKTIQEKNVFINGKKNTIQSQTLILELKGTITKLNTSRKLNQQTGPGRKRAWGEFT